MHMSRLAGEIFMIVLGMVLAAVPLMLWVATSPAVFTLVLLVAGVSAGLLIAINDRLESSREGPHAARQAVLVSCVPDRFFEEVHRISPLNYHHSRKQKPVFLGSMEKIRRLVD